MKIIKALWLFLVSVLWFNSCLNHNRIDADKFCDDKFLQFVDTNGNDVFTDASVFDLSTDDFYITLNSDPARYYIGREFQKRDNAYILNYSGDVSSNDTIYFHFGTINTDTIFWKRSGGDHCVFYLRDLIYNGDTLKHYHSCDEACSEKDEILSIIIEGDSTT